MLTEHDFMQDKIKTLEGIIKYKFDKSEALEKENIVLKKEIKKLEKRIKYLTNQVEEML